MASPCRAGPRTCPLLKVLNRSLPIGNLRSDPEDVRPEAANPVAAAAVA